SPAASGDVDAGVKLPVPSPSRIVTWSRLKFAATRSGRPSLLKSPTATDQGLRPASSGEVDAGVKLPAASPSRIVTLPSLKFAVARSGRPSLLKSPTVTDKGSSPTASG